MTLTKADEAALAAKYLLIPRGKVWQLVGGAVGFLALCFSVSYGTVTGVMKQTAVTYEISQIRKDSVHAARAIAWLDSIESPFRFDLASLESIRTQLAATRDTVAAMPAIRFGCVNKPTSGHVQIGFGHHYGQAPVVVLAPEWLGPDAEVGGIETVNEVNNDGFRSTSKNAAPNFYSCWLAVGR